MAEREAASRVLSRGQVAVLAVLVAALAVGVAVDFHAVLVGLVAASMITWTLFVGFRAALWLASRRHRPAATGAADITDGSLPGYTLLVPLYREGKMLPGLIDAIGRLLYPADRLQVLLLIEEDDEETLGALERLELPRELDIRAIEIPGGGPRTKPNALNFGLFHVSGEHCVVYDAEDRPEPDQLLKAVAAFRSSSPEVVCLQARLAFWNAASSWITRFYWADYVVQFEWTLAGLVAMNLVPPLGGTSNHFRTEALREVALDSASLPFRAEYIGGWDPYNVTEDAELSGALTRRGYRVGLLDSTTWEESAAHLGVADRQRRRWLKGFAQTAFVYMRRPWQTSRQMGVARFFFYILLMLGTPLTLLLSPFFWAATIVYFATRATAIVELFPLPLFYLGVTLMVAGNLVLFYQLVAACLKREGYGGVKYMILAPAWWIFMTWSAYAMVADLVVRPHHWHKTEHGHDFARAEAGSALGADAHGLADDLLRAGLARAPEGARARASDDERVAG